MRKKSRQRLALLVSVSMAVAAFNTVPFEKNSSVMAA